MRLGQEADTTWISLEMYCEIQKRMKMIEHMRLLYLISCCRYKYLIFNMFFIYTHTMSCVLQVRQRHLKNTVSCFYVYIVVTIWGNPMPKNLQNQPTMCRMRGVNCQGVQRLVHSSIFSWAPGRRLSVLSVSTCLHDFPHTDVVWISASYSRLIVTMY